MSAFLDRADSLATYLATVDGLQSLAWVVDRKKNLQSEFVQATAKKAGLGVIALLAGRNNDRELPALRLSCRYTITIFTKPLVRAGDAEPEDMAELTARAIHHWFPSETATKRQVRFEVTDVAIIDAAEFHAIRITAESVVQCSSTAIPIITPP